MGKRGFNLLLIDASFDAAESPERRFKCGVELLEKLSADSKCFLLSLFLHYFSVVIV